MVPTRSILRVASTQNTQTTNNSKRVTFADEVLNIFYLGPRKARPPPPSTVPPPVPVPGRSSPKEPPRNIRPSRTSSRDTPRSANPSPRKENPSSPRLDRPSRPRADNPSRHRPETPSRPRADNPSRHRPETPSRPRADNTTKPRSDDSSRPRVDNPARSRVDNRSRSRPDNSSRFRSNSPGPMRESKHIRAVQVASTTTSSIRSGSSSYRHHHHHRHGHCRHHQGRRHERRERRRREKNRLSSRSGTDLSVIGSEVAPTQRADRAARERRKYDAGVVKRRTSPENRRESRMRAAVVRPVSRLVDMKQKVVGRQNARAIEATPRYGARPSTRSSEQKPRSAEALKTAERTRPSANIRRRARNSDQQGSNPPRAKADVTAAARRRRPDTRQREQAKREERALKDEMREREARMKALRANGALTKGRRFVAKSLALNRDGYPADMLDLIEAKTIFKLYLRCRERTRKGDDLLVESGQRLEEAKLRRKMLDEEVELKALEKEYAASENTDPATISSEKRVLRKKRSGLQHFAADELGSSLSSMRGLSRGQLDRAVLAAAIARADRFETYRYDGATYY